jgi:DNA-directed RNA polymerase subunit beta
MKDSSMRMKPGISGTIVEVRIFSRRGIEKDERTMEIERAEIERIRKDRNDEFKIVAGPIFDRLSKILVGAKAAKAVGSVKKGAKITAADLQELQEPRWFTIEIEGKDVSRIKDLKEEYDSIVKILDEQMNDRIEKLQSGDDLPSGVLKVVKVYVAVKRKLQPGDKMAGRHGNKGVISKICPAEDMPYLADGTPVDVVLNPLGVPSRMNIGQIFETHLGWASHELGNQIKTLLGDYYAQGKKGDAADLRSKVTKVYSAKDDVTALKAMNDNEIVELSNNLSRGVPFASPVFDGASVDDITAYLQQVGADSSGQFDLYDGRTGEKFDRKVTVGIIYMLKLHHLVDDKLHARSIGPYSLVTQQPLGGKSHFGGQRFGEMECWALQAYGASYTLQELLTVKSDDVIGRTRVYESIVKGNHTFESGVPESFNVMVKELRSLCLNVELKQKED